MDRAGANETESPFGTLGGDGQMNLFGAADERQPARSYAPDPETVRRRLRALIETAREARSMPWSERDARMWQTVVPQMAGWLPDDEADQMRLSFAREFDRLMAA